MIRLGRRQVVAGKAMVARIWKQVGRLLRTNRFRSRIGGLLIILLTQLMMTIILIPTYPEQPPFHKLDFTWVSHNERLCDTGKGKGVVAEQHPRILPVLVHTSRSNFVERSMIRKTYGSLGLYRGWEIRLIFLLGEAQPGAPEETHYHQDGITTLQTEQGQFGDLVIGSFIDHYHNMSYKHLMGYKWILEFCPMAEFVLKVDDDFFIDPIRWIDWLADNLNQYAMDRNHRIPDLICQINSRARAWRARWQWWVYDAKWYVTREEWLPDYYPDYCSGLAYAIRAPLLEQIYNVSHSTKMLWIDDVFVTGILREKAAEQFGLQPEVRDMVGGVAREDEHELSRVRWDCEAGGRTFRGFGAACEIQRGRYFEMDAKCWWDKVLYDQQQQSPFLKRG